MAYEERDIIAGIRTAGFREGKTSLTSEEVDAMAATLNLYLMQKEQQEFGHRLNLLYGFYNSIGKIYEQDSHLFKKFKTGKVKEQPKKLQSRLHHEMGILKDAFPITHDNLNLLNQLHPVTQQMFLMEIKGHFGERPMWAEIIQSPQKANHYMEPVFYKIETVIRSGHNDAMVYLVIEPLGQLYIDFTGKLPGLITDANFDSKVGPFLEFVKCFFNIVGEETESRFSKYIQKYLKQLKGDKKVIM